MQRLFLIAAGLIIGAIVLLFFLNLRKSWEITPAYPAKEMPGAAFQNWNMFNDPQKEFQVLFPSVPKNASKELRNEETSEVSKQDVFVSEKKNTGAIYMISRVKFPKKDFIKDDRKVLQAAVDDLLNANAQNKLISSKEEEFQGRKALHFEIRNQEVYTQGIAFIRDESLYLLTAISKNEDRDDKEFKSFIDSFQLTKQSEIINPRKAGR